MYANNRYSQQSSKDQWEEVLKSGHAKTPGIPGIYRLFLNSMEMTSPVSHKLQISRADLDYTLFFSCSYFFSNCFSINSATFNESVSISPSPSPSPISLNDPKVHNSFNSRVNFNRSSAALVCPFTYQSCPLNLDSVKDGWNGRKIFIPGHYSRLPFLSPLLLQFP